MPNVTLAIDSDLLKKARDYAHKHDTTLNALLRDYLEATVRDAQDSDARLQQFLELTRNHSVRSDGRTYSREERNARAA
jgi:hypothetical protein